MRVALKPLLEQIWHAPDNVQLMDPLPLMHRRGIILGVLLVVIGILLPGANTAPVPAQSPRDAQINLSQPDAQQPAGSIASPQEQLDAAMPDAEPGSNDTFSMPSPAPGGSAQSSGGNGGHFGGIEEQWRSYRLESGKTLAQLFRDNNLPPADVYAMAQAEGDGKPLSNLQSGQVVKIRQNAGGVVTGLVVEGGSGDILFTRQADGSFTRAR